MKKIFSIIMIVSLLVGVPTVGTAESYEATKTVKSVAYQKADSLADTLSYYGWYSSGGEYGSKSLIAVDTCVLQNRNNSNPLKWIVVNIKVKKKGDKFVTKYYQCDKKNFSWKTHYKGKIQGKRTTLTKIIKLAKKYCTETRQNDVLHSCASGAFGLLCDVAGDHGWFCSWSDSYLEGLRQNMDIYREDGSGATAKVGAEAVANDRTKKVDRYYYLNGESVSEKKMLDYLKSFD